MAILDQICDGPIAKFLRISIHNTCTKIHASFIKPTIHPFFCTYLLYYKEVIIIGTTHHLNNLDTRTITIADSDGELVDQLKDLGVYVGSQLTMEKHVSQLSRTSFFQLRSIGNTRHVLILMQFVLLSNP